MIVVAALVSVGVVAAGAYGADTPTHTRTGLSDQGTSSQRRPGLVRIPQVPTASVAHDRLSDQIDEGTARAIANDVADDFVIQEEAERRRSVLLSDRGCRPVAPAGVVGRDPRTIAPRRSRFPTTTPSTSWCQWVCGRARPRPRSSRPHGCACVTSRTTPRASWCERRSGAAPWSRTRRGGRASTICWYRRFRRRAGTHRTCEACECGEHPGHGVHTPMITKSSYRRRILPVALS